MIFVTKNYNYSVSWPGLDLIFKRFSLATFEILEDTAASMPEIMLKLSSAFSFLAGSI